MKVKNVNTSCIGGNSCFLFSNHKNAVIVLPIILCACIQLYLTQHSPMGVVQERIAMLTAKRNTPFIVYE